MNKILIGIIFITFFLSLTTQALAIDVGIQTYDYYRIYAVGNGTKYGIKNIFGIGISDFSPKVPTFSLTVWGNDTVKKFGGDGWLTGSGLLTNPMAQVYYSIKLLNITDCTDFNTTRIFCNGTGVFIMDFKNGNPQIKKTINTFSFDLYDSNGNGTIGIGDTINVAGGETSSDDLFNITMIVPNISRKIRTPFIYKTIMSGIQVQYSDYAPFLTFPEPQYIGQTLYATNNVIIRNIGKLPLNVYVCGNNFTGIVDFAIKRGTCIGHCIVLPVCDDSLPHKNGILLDQFLYSTPLLPNKHIQLLTPRITYMSEYEQGELEFMTELA
jgi:hypothetical protein